MWHVVLATKLSVAWFQTSISQLCGTGAAEEFVRELQREAEEICAEYIEYIECAQVCHICQDQSGKCRDPGCMRHIRIRDTLGSETLPDPGNYGTETGNPGSG